MIKNLKIKYKLLIFLLVSILLIFGISFYSLSQIVKLADPIVNRIPTQIDAIKKTSKLDNLAQLIKYYDEVLTQSARNYAFTGDGKWKERYKDHESHLDSIIKETIKEGDQEDKKFFDSVDSANLALVKLEYQSIELVDSKDKAGAVRILEGTEYSRLKEEYKHGLEEYVNRRGSEYEKGLEITTTDLSSTIREAKSIANSAYRIIIVVGILVILFIIIAGLVVVQQVLKPLNKLIKGAKEIGEGNLNYAIDINSNDEIGLLGKAFNEMADDIRKSQTILETKINERTAELEKTKLGLEEVVASRTAELEQLKNDLEKTVAKRTEELTHKMAEMEQVNKLTVERELKMIELKKEIEKLKSGASIKND